MAFMSETLKLILAVDGEARTIDRASHSYAVPGLQRHPLSATVYNLECRSGKSNDLNASLRIENGWPTH